jgi:hypothetical protein
MNLVKRSSTRAHSPDSSDFIGTVVIDRDLMRPTSHSIQRTKLFARRKHSSNPSSMHVSGKGVTGNDQSHTHRLSSPDSSLSRISFDRVADILTVSRMGSIFYCLEDLYSKVFTQLCTFDEFTTFVLKSEQLSVKQVTLSEKISIEQQNPLLKKMHDLRYRLIPINASDYFLKLKQLLHTHSHRGKTNEGC